MSAISLTIDAADLQVLGAEADKIQQTLTSQDLILIGGRAVQQALKEHFEELSRDSTHHQTALSLGADPTGFYTEAAESVNNPIAVDSETVSVSISGPAGLAQRFFGGTIEAKPGSALTIPARAEAYGHRAGEFANLRLVVFGDTGLAALIDRDGPGDEGDVYYWLVRSVTQQPDPTVLPTEEEMIDPAIAAMREEIALAFERLGGTGK
jgi:hypothetical protein